VPKHLVVSEKELQEALCRYITDTLIFIDSVRGFCEKISKWMLKRETELNMMMDIKNRVDNIDLNVNHVTQSQEKGKAFLEYMKSKVTQVTADSRRAELEEELAAVLKDTLGGLEKLDCFLDAVEKLAVTSLHVFMENQVLHLPKGIALEHVQVVIAAARLICPLLLEFKRDAQVFFLPRLQNVEVVSYQLDRYIQTTQKICTKLEKSVTVCHSSFSDFCLKMTTETLVDLDVDLPEDDMQRMLYHINQLDEIRMNQHFRTVYLFQEESCGFIREFSERQPRMLQFLNELEESAVQLDRMNKGAKISSVAGSSVGAVGGVLSIIGLALIPVTAGVSLALTMTGVGLGITSGVNSVVTTATEVGVNVTQQKKASEVLKLFMEDVQSLQDCLEEVTNRETSEITVVVEVSKVLCKAGVVGKNIDALVDVASAAKLLQSEELITGVGKVVAQEGKALRNVPRVASDIPDIGQAAVKGPLALSKSARASLIAVNALFLGMDIFFICKDSISLAKGSETEVSRFIRARAALWSSEIDSWQRIHDSLCQGLLASEKNEAILETPFYPELDMKKQREAEKEVALDEVDEKVKEKQLCVMQ
uniref:Apolipoprotein L n=1 Tax=Seriola dumerili TaxID=41447 RepID=A0A3B4VGC0_SERDU